MSTTTALIAIVDDDVSFRTALESFARSLGYAAAGFASAEAFLASGSVARADCIVSDVQMPGIDGIELVDRLGRMGSTTSVIIVTGGTEPAIRARARDRGVLCVLQKPFDPQQMADCLARAVEA